MTSSVRQTPMMIPRTTPIRRILLLGALAGLLAGPAAAQNYTITPTPFQTAFSNAGAVINNACIWTYVAGTTTAATTYSDTAGTPNANPIRSDSAGRFTAYLIAGTNYKFVYESACVPPAHGTTLRTADNISGVPSTSATVDVTGTAGETISAGLCAYLSDGSASKTAGQWFKCDATNAYSSVTPIVGLVPSTIVSGAAGTIRLAGPVTGLSSLSIGSAYYASTAGTISTTPGTNRRPLGAADSATSVIVRPWALQTPPPNSGLSQGRLTLTTGTPVTTGDVSGASTVYYTPYTGNLIALYDGTATWTNYTFSEQSVALSGLVTAQAYDVFGFATTTGAVNLETAEWANATVTMTLAAPGVVTWTGHGMSTGASVTFTTNGALPTGLTANTQYFITVVDANSFKLSTTRANVAAGTFIATSVSQSGVHTGHQPQARQTAITLQNGVYVKSGATTRRYLGSFFTSGTNTTEDSATKRYVSNYGNRLPRTLTRTESTGSWTYSAVAFRQANGSASNQVEVFIGVAETPIELSVSTLVSHSAGGQNAVVAIGEDSTTAIVTGFLLGQTTSTTVNAQVVGWVRRVPTVGYHAYLWLESSSAVVTTTFVSASITTNGGLTGTTVQ